MKTLRILVLFSVFSLLAVSQSRATDILLLQGYPDLTGSYMHVDYTTNNNIFNAYGYTTQYTDSQTNQFPVYDNASFNYTLTAFITRAGLLTNGTLTISGDPDFGSGPLGFDTSLLTGNLITGTNGVAFGSGDGPNQIFQFKFDVTGGSLAGAFGGNGASGGIIFTADFGAGDHPFTGSWTSNFDSEHTHVGAIDAFAVPEPSSILLVSAGVLCLVARRRLNAPRL